MEISIKEKLDEVFKKTELYNNEFDNSNSKYQSYRDAKEIYIAGMKHMLSIIESKTYVDINTGQYCMHSDFDFDDVIFKEK